MDLFPYEPREYQEDFVSAASATLKDQGHIVIESGTGTGKTVCALTAALQVALAHGKKVAYLTRTNSQQRQVLLELRRINTKKQVFGMGVQGRQSTCPLFARDPDLKQGNAEELSRLCGERKKRSLAGKEGGCRFYDAVLATDFDQILDHCRKELPTVEEFSQYCDSLGLCPYELGKELLANATVVTAPYAYFFAPFVRDAFVERLNVSLAELIIVVDEAHNLPDYARESRTIQLSRVALDLVLKELDEYGDPEVVDGASVRDVVDRIGALLDEAVKEYVIDEDGLIPPDFLQAGLMEAFTITSRQMAIACKAMMTHGEIVRESKKEQGRLPRSYIFSLGAFLSFWLKMDEEYYVKLVVGGENPRFEGFCLDPSVACSFLMESAGSLHMSGTLAPLYEYRDSIGMGEDCVLRSFPSPFPAENRRVLYSTEVTTKYDDMAQDDTIVPRMEDLVVASCNALDRNTVVFFPSYVLMDRFLSDGMLARIRKKVHVEERGMPQAELMSTVQSFKKATLFGQVLFAVMGGRVSEGIDFPDRELQVAILAGIPFPKPTAKQRALLHYYEMKFGKGWEYTVKVPASRKMLQSIGRLIRTEKDVGAALILDKRAKQFSDRMELVAAESIPNDLLAFFKERGV
ncbi:MAG: ATP-dependent DNA helicase [Methanomassiliicoccales archaeon]|nr:ATP-dependent DNA helicase [Methanomassiliicoccales archaeon]